MENEKLTETETAKANGSASGRMYATAEGIAIIENPQYTPRGRAIFRFQRIQALKVDPTKEEKLYQLIKGCVNTLADEAKLGTLSDELIDQKTLELATAVEFGGFGELPVPVDEITKHGARLLADGYSGSELDIIRAICAHGAGFIVDFDPERITIDDRSGRRKYTRYQLREAGRPQSWTNVESWHAQFPPLKA
jgi:hypothetical protein